MARKRAKPKPQLPSDVKKALNHILCYMYDDELEDAREHFQENGDIDGHVFSDIVKIQNWMAGTNVRPEDELGLEDEK